MLVGAVHTLNNHLALTGHGAKNLVGLVVSIVSGDHYDKIALSDSHGLLSWI
jgi:hypothetical protein